MVLRIGQKLRGILTADHRHALRSAGAQKDERERHEQFTLANAGRYSKLAHRPLYRQIQRRNCDMLTTLLTDPESAGMQNGTSTGERNLMTYHEFEGLRDQNKVFSGILTFSSTSYAAPVSLGQYSDSSPANINMVSGGYFPTLGVDPMLGHVFGAEVDQGRNAHPIALVSYSYWDRKLGRDPDRKS